MAKDPTASTAYAANRFAPRPSAPGAVVGREMSPKQRDFVTTLITRAHDYDRRKLQATPVQGPITREMLDAALSLCTPARTVRHIQDTLNRTDVTVPQLFDILKAQDKSLAASVRAVEAKAQGRIPAPVVTGTGTRTEPEDGKSYRTSDGRVFHAYKTQSGRLCVKLWTKAADGTGSFVYWGLASRMPAVERMTLEQAQEFGRATGTCSECMRHLTNDESVALGIGPICRGKF